MTCGIYQIATGDGRCYIGQSVDIERRWSNERWLLRRGDFNKCRNHHLQNAWNKYGEEAFTFDVLEVVDLEGLTTAEKRTLLNEREQWWMDNTNSVFNVLESAGSPLGFKQSPESIALRVAANTNKVRGPEAIANMKAGQQRRRQQESPEDRARAAEAMRRLWESPEHRARVVEKNSGLTRSDETRSRLRESHLGIYPSDATRAKRSASLKGRVPWNKGKKTGPRSEEDRAKISAGHRARNASR